MANEQIEEYLIDSGFPFEEVEEGLWLIHDEEDQVDNIVLHHNDPVLTFRVKLMNAPDGDEGRLELFTKLLELNATSMVAGAYGLEDDAVVAVDTLQTENLDFNEFQAALDAIVLSIREHYKPLTEIANKYRDSEE
jgi:hypothetical protein